MFNITLGLLKVLTPTGWQFHPIVDITVDIIVKLSVHPTIDIIITYQYYRALSLCTISLLFHTTYLPILFAYLCQ